MKKLFEVVIDRHKAEEDLDSLRKDFKEKQAKLIETIAECKRLENVGEIGLDLAKIQLSEDIITVKGNPYGQTDDVTKFGAPYIADSAILDIAKGCDQLKQEFIGNKVYDGFYQRWDCRYGYGPRHGGITDRIELKARYMTRTLTADEKDACIYYLKNYKAIREAAKKAAAESSF